MSDSDDAPIPWRLDYRFTIPVSPSNFNNFMEEIYDLAKKDNTCGDVVESTFRHLKGEHLHLETYNDFEDGEGVWYPKKRLQKEFPAIDFHKVIQAVHFCYQGENGSFEDVYGDAYSHEYVIFQNGQSFWSLQAWVGEYEAKLSGQLSMSEVVEMLDVLRSRKIDIEKLKKYFYLDFPPDGFGEKRRNAAGLDDEDMSYIKLKFW